MLGRFLNQICVIKIRTSYQGYDDFEGKIIEVDENWVYFVDDKGNHHVFNKDSIVMFDFIDL